MRIGGNPVSFKHCIQTLSGGQAGHGMHDCNLGIIGLCHKGIYQQVLTVYIMKVTPCA